MKLKFSLLALLSAFSLFCNGCTTEKTVVESQANQVQISFSWWGNDTRNEYTIAAIEKFEELNPNIKVKCNYSEWSGYQARNNVQMASNTESDVMQINYAWINQYSPDGNGYYDINKLSDYVDFSNFQQSDLNFGMQNGKLNAIPIAYNTQTIYYNKTIYDQYGLKLPKTWDDIFNAGKIMNGKNYPLSMAAKGAWFYCISYAEQKTGKDFMNLKGDLQFNPDDIKIMLDFYCRLVNEKVMPNVESFDKLNISSGDYAGVLAWLSDAKNYCDDAQKNSYDIQIGDYTANNKLDGWYIKPATLYAISKNTDYPKESGMLLNYLLNSKEMAEYQGIEKGIPISKAALTYLKENSMLNGLQYDAYKQMDENKSQLKMISPYFENEELIDDFKSACNDVLYNKATSSDKASELYDTFNEVLIKN